jgi:hypothetical protein
MGLFGKLKEKGERWAMSKILAALVTKAAEGGFGPKVKAAYWLVSGQKTNIGMLFGLAWAVLEYGTSSGFCGAHGWDCTGWSNTLIAVAGFLLAAGLYDGAIRTPAPFTPPDAVTALKVDQAAAKATLK